MISRLNPHHVRAPILALKKGFTLVELLVVLSIIAILTAIAAPLIPALLKSNQLDSNIATLSGVLEQARETAISNNTFVWVVFAPPPTSSPGVGTWVASVQSIDGTDSVKGSNTWLTNLTIPGTANLQLLSKIQNLPGVQIVDPTTITGSVQNNGIAPPTGAVPLQGPTSTNANSLNWTVTPAKYTEGFSSTTSFFTQGIQFTPDGEAHVITWANNIQFGMTSTTGSATAIAKSVVLFNISRLTGKLTVYRL